MCAGPTCRQLQHALRHSPASATAQRPGTYRFRTGSAADIDRAVVAARTAFRTTWGKNVTGFARARLIHKLADLIERDAQELAELETLNNGKPVRIAR